MTQTVASFVRGWFREPLPTFELRSPSARWGTPRAAVPARAFRVVDVIDETPTVRTFVLAAPDGGAPALAYRPGQHLTVVVDIDGRTERRCYSFSSSPLTGARPAITVRRTPDGVVSRHLHDRVRAGDLLKALPPTGEFTLEPDSSARRHVVLVAGGVGITPLMSLAESLLVGERGSRVTLLCGHRSADEIVFHERLAALQRGAPDRFVVQYSLDAPPAGWAGLEGPLDGAAVRAAVGDQPVDEWFVCGPEPMMDSVREALLTAGVPDGRVHVERFSYASTAAMRIPEREATLRFAGSGRHVVARPGQTLLEAGLAAGVALPSSCTMGGCGACKVRTLEGRVVMREPNCLTDAERAAGYVLTCCAYADGDVAIAGH
ncbi:MAG: ferredoxin--NADP reductase [Lysobacterales bacterium]|nr:MAG: ferredoxin--NADP reductase [Xanthomonadales bacterium]